MSVSYLVTGAVCGLAGALISARLFDDRRVTIRLTASVAIGLTLYFSAILPLRYLGALS